MKWKSIAYRGATLKPGGFYSGAFVGRIGTWQRGALVQVWPNGKRWDAHVDVNSGSNCGRDGHGFGKTPQSAIDSALREAIARKQGEVAVLRELLGLK